MKRRISFRQERGDQFLLPGCVFSSYSLDIVFHVLGDGFERDFFVVK